jgi:valyl-tRNA synthetase
MWPFIVLDWPQNSEEFEKLYSRMTIVTGFDIIFFWVARMIMLGIYATNKEPFRNVYIHSLVRDEKGHKMSKSRGNVIDPLVLCEAYGADAVRYTLASMASPGRDIKMGRKSVEIGRNFLTKLWNAVRFAQMNSCTYNKDFDVNNVRHPLGQWIIHMVKNMIIEVEAALENYRFDEASRVIQQCVWNSFCDWYMEFIKPILQKDVQDIQDVTCWAILQFVRVLYPFTPFMSKKLGGELGITDISWPDAASIAVDCANSVRRINLLQYIITSIRSVRQCLGIPLSEKLEISVDATSKDLSDVVSEYGDALFRMAGVSLVKDVCDQNIPIIVDGGIIYMGFCGKIDIPKEKERLNKTKKELTQVKDESLRKLGDENFLAKAAEEVIQEHRNRIATLDERIDRLNYVLKSLPSI